MPDSHRHSAERELVRPLKRELSYTTPTQTTQGNGSLPDLRTGELSIAGLMYGHNRGATAKVKLLVVF